MKFGGRQGRELRRRCERIVEGLDMPDPFDLEVLCRTVGEARGRPLRVLIWPARRRFGVAVWHVGSAGERGRDRHRPPDQLAAPAAHRPARDRPHRGGTQLGPGPGARLCAAVAPGSRPGHGPAGAGPGQLRLTAGTGGRNDRLVAQSTHRRAPPRPRDLVRLGVGHGGSAAPLWTMRSGAGTGRCRSGTSCRFFPLWWCCRW